MCNKSSDPRLLAFDLLTTVFLGLKELTDLHIFQHTSAAKYPPWRRWPSPEQNVWVPQQARLSRSLLSLSVSVWLLPPCRAFLIPLSVISPFLLSLCLFMNDCLLLHFQRCCRCYIEIAPGLPMMCNIFMLHVSSIQSKKCEMNFEGNDFLKIAIAVNNSF